MNIKLIYILLIIINIPLLWLLWKAVKRFIDIIYIELYKYKIVPVEMLADFRKEAVSLGCLSKFNENLSNKKSPLRVKDLFISFENAKNEN